jgi:uncharacterized OB-fold protein
MSNEDRREIKIKPKTFLGKDWFTDPDSGKDVCLRGNKCPSCGEVYFPKEFLCLRCLNQDMEEITLSHTGTLYSFTVVRQQPPVYKGPVPYAIGIIELPEGIRVTSLLTDCDFKTLEIGKKMELVVEKLHEDAEGQEVVCYKFRTAKN